MALKQVLGAITRFAAFAVLLVAVDSRHCQLPVNYLLTKQFNVAIIDKICTSRTLPESYSQSMSVLEFTSIMQNHGIISIPGIHFDRTDVMNCLIAVCSRSGSR